MNIFLHFLPEKITILFLNWLFVTKRRKAWVERKIKFVFIEILSENLARYFYLMFRKNEILKYLRSFVIKKLRLNARNTLWSHQSAATCLCTVMYITGATVLSWGDVPWHLARPWHSVRPQTVTSSNQMCWVLVTGNLLRSKFWFFMSKRNVVFLAETSLDAPCRCTYMNGILSSHMYR